MKRWLEAALCAAWVTTSAVGFVLIARHDAAAGESTSAPATWPSQTSLSRASDRPTLLVFVHPQCPCSRATVRELERLMARTGDRMRVIAVFARPAGMEPGSERGALLDLARGISSLEIVFDAGGVEAKRFAALTSGATVLYSSAGSRLFTGGLTASRGHEGTSAGTDAIEALVRDHAPPSATASPVFGCALNDTKGNSR